MLKSMCINCHALDVMLRRRGSTALQWRACAEKRCRCGSAVPSPRACRWKVLGAELERWFGPKGSISDLVRLRRALAGAAAESGPGSGERHLPRIHAAERAEHAAQPDSGRGRTRVDLRMGCGDECGAEIRSRHRAVPQLSRPNRKRRPSYAVRDGMGVSGWR